MFDCPCGKKHCSRSTVWKHKKKMSEASTGDQNNVQKGVQSNVHLNVQSNSEQSANSGQFIKEINLKGEFDRMTEKVNLKKDQEPKYECPACGEKFNEKKKFCPGCGAEFE